MIDFDNLEKMIAEKYISVQKHPTLDLYIYNYTHRAQFDRVWNNETLQCRGLIMDGNRNIVSRPFRKFFNWGEITNNHIHDWGDAEYAAIKAGKADCIDPECPDNLTDDFTITEKMDGSLGISYFDPDDKMWIATRGSFISEQAKKANQILAANHPDFMNDLVPDFTFLFEIIYPQNRIVVNYGDREELILLAIIDTETGEEKPYKTVKELGRNYGIPVVPRYDGITDFTKIEQRPNSEGYVVHFPATGLRFKLKFDEYVRLHRILTGINAKRIWELLSQNLTLDPILERVPDEFFAWVKDTEKRLNAEYYEIANKAATAYNSIKDLPTRKDQALAIKDSPYRGIVFNMLDKKAYDKIIWKMIEPEYEAPFKVDEP